MRIVFIHRNTFQNRPPVVSLITILSQLGKHPMVITAGLNEAYKKQLEDKGIEAVVVPFQLKGNAARNYFASQKWGNTVEKYVRKLAKKENLLLWIEGNYTFAALSTRFINDYPHILQIQEMFNAPGIKGWIYERKISKISHTAAACIVNEYNRAHLYRILFKLKNLPYILPNKPAFILGPGEIEKLHEDYIEYDPLFDKKVIIYQGLLTTGRSNFIPYLEAVKKLNEQANEYRVVFVGKDTGMVEEYRNKGYEFAYIPFVSAPNYLYFTSRAYLGIVTYLPDILNNVYCAPNKIFEYAAYGIPIIGNDIPGLRFTIESNHCGKVCEETPESIYKELIYIIDHYDEMSLAAKQFYNATDNKRTVKQILDDVENIIGVTK